MTTLTLHWVGAKEAVDEEAEAEAEAEGEASGGAEGPGGAGGMEKWGPLEEGSDIERKRVREEEDQRGTRQSNRNRSYRNWNDRLSRVRTCRCLGDFLNFKSAILGIFRRRASDIKINNS